MKVDIIDNMSINTKEEVKRQKILRQITDHIIQCLQRIEYNIEYVTFLQKNTAFQDVSEKFFLTQIDRFSRDTLITFSHILDKDRKGNTLHSLIVKIKDKQKRKKLELQLEKLRQDAQIIISHRNKVVAHHETDYNSGLGDWYPMQPFSYAYAINPCNCNRVRLKAEKLFWKLKSTLYIDGVGMMITPGGKIENIFKTKVLGVRKSKNKGLIISHKCRYKDCLLK